MDKSFTSYRIEERGYVAYVKREIHNLVAKAKFTEQQVRNIDVIVSDIASNLIRHAGNGELLYRVQGGSEGTSEFEIISIDRNVAAESAKLFINAGSKSAESLDADLINIQQLSTLSQVYSRPGWGKILYAVVKTQAENKAPVDSLTLDIKALCINKPREIVCGDGYRIKKTDFGMNIFFGDGLGHGEKAKEAVDCAGDAFDESDENEPTIILRQIHEKVRQTRGLVATVATFNVKDNTWKICGIGNILSRIYTGVQGKNYMSYNGTLGLIIPNSMKSTVVAIEKNQQLIMCSDGISTRWDLNNYPSVFKYDPTVLAASIYKDFSRGNDDSSILIAKVN